MGSLKEADVNSVFEKLQGGTAKARNEGLEDLRRLFNRGTAWIDEEKTDSVFHFLLENLFRIAQLEKQAFLKASKSNSKNIVSLRLETTAAALRLVIDKSAYKLGQKTVIAVLDHIVDTLPDGEGLYCAPLQVDYLKCFHTLVLFPSMLEHLRPKQWQRYLDFVLDGLAKCFLDDADDESSSQNRQMSVSFRPGLSNSIRGSQKSNARNEQISSIDTTKDLLASLTCLTAIANCPLLTRLVPISEATLMCVERLTRYQETAFEVINNILPVCLTDNLRLATSVFNRICGSVQRCWNKNSAALREQMLISLFYLRYTYLTVRTDADAIDSHMLDSLIGAMWSEMERRTKRDFLQLEDLSFMEIANPSPISLQSVAPASGSERIALAWSNLLVLSQLIVGLDQARKATEESHQEKAIGKRRRLEHSFEDILWRILNGVGSARVVAIQVALFTVDFLDNVPFQILEDITKLDSLLVDDDPWLFSWTSVLLARCSTISVATEPKYHDFWQRVWTTASRAISNSSCSRYACHLMKCLLQSGTIQSNLSLRAICDSIFADGSSGPTPFTDTAIDLLTSTLRDALFEDERLYRLFAGRALSWLEARWFIPTVPDHLHNLATATYGQPRLLFDLLSMVTGLSQPLSLPAVPSFGGSIYRAAYIDTRDLQYTKFLPSIVHGPKPNGKIRVPVKTKTASLSKQAYLTPEAVEDFLAQKMKAFRAAWKFLSSERISNVNADIAEVAATACVVSSTILHMGEQKASRLAVQLNTNELFQVIAEFCLKLPGDTFDEVVIRVAARLLQLKSIDDSATRLLAISRELYISSLLKVMEQGSESQDQGMLDLDFMDSFDGTASQTSLLRTNKVNLDQDRLDLQSASTPRKAFLTFKLLLKLDNLYAHHGYPLDAAAMNSFIDNLILLDPDALFSTRSVVQEVLGGEATISRTDAKRLVEAYGQLCLDNDNLERCEAALCLCSQIMTSLSHLWTDDEEDQLANDAYDIYSWYIGIVLGKSVASQRVLHSMSTLVKTVLEVNPSYGTTELHSPRTVLLQLFQAAKVGLKFEMADKLSKLFDGYVLSEHTAIFQDIVDILPSDPDDLEGISIRVYILACLGAQWHTILRQAVYHIFETAANIPSVSTFARKCITMMCDLLNLNSGRSLLRLFSSQLFYTWLAEGNIEGIPYAVFGYDSLLELIKDTKDELIGQIVMRASSMHAQVVSMHLSCAFEKSVESSFAKAAAYSLITDVSITRSSREFGKAESFLVKAIGEDRYSQLLFQHFPDILGNIILRLTDDRGLDRSQKDASHHQNALSANEVMCSYSSSTSHFLPGQQPSFRAKYLLQILERLSSHSGVDLAQLGSAPVLTAVYRSLLDDANPALGPLHSCATLRKVRVTISVASSAALTGYPLEMLIHNIIPYMVQFHSAQDVFGIVWYLLEHGRAYLQERLSFVAGLGVTIFASVSQFMNSSQDSTTQESHFTSTMSKAKEFLQWLGQYMQALDTAKLSPLTRSSFNDMISHAKSISNKGSNSRSTPEGCLLYNLLVDQINEQSLLSKPLFHHILRILCDDFLVTPDAEDDILAIKEDAVRLHPVLWEVVRDSKLGRQFRSWLGHSLGRATNILGPDEVISTRRPRFDEDQSFKRKDLDALASYSRIISQLKNYLWEGNRNAASIAEQALQSIFSAFPTTDLPLYIDNDENKALFHALRFGEFKSPQRFDRAMSDNKNQMHQLENAGETWARNLALELCQSLHYDPVLSCLPPVLELIPSASIHVLAPVVHLILLAGLSNGNTVGERISSVFSRILSQEKDVSPDQVALVLDTISYLRRCMKPAETSIAQRQSWLNIDFKAAAEAASRCGRYNDALLLLETYLSQQSLRTERSSKRSSSSEFILPKDLLSTIYLNIDDPDFFYGTQQDASIPSIASKLRHEGAGKRALSFQSALIDSKVKNHGLHGISRMSNATTVAALNLASFHGLASLVNRSSDIDLDQKNTDVSVKCDMNLEQWNLGLATTENMSNNVTSRVISALISGSEVQLMLHTIDDSMLQITNDLAKGIMRKSVSAELCSTLAVLVSLRETIAESGIEEISSSLSRRLQDSKWVEHTSFELVEKVLLGREALVSAIRSNSSLREALKLTRQDALLLELQVLRSSLAVGLAQNMGQFCLNRAAYMSDLVEPATSIGLKVEVAVRYDLASTFWTHGETAASITILQDLHSRNDLRQQAIVVSQSEIFTDLGQKLTQARLDRPDEITSQYLQPAIASLGTNMDGSKAGRVYHNFAAFCDQQLRDPDNLDEYRRVEKLRNRKKQEVEDLEALKKTKEGKERDLIRGHLAKAQTWFKLDEQEWRRLRKHREGLLSSCLENYLRGMRACDDFPNDVLRFLALWLEQAQNVDANLTVDKHLTTVPSYKFAPLMNQLSSRVLDNQDKFQKILFDLMFRICNQHPYHSLYQVFATSKFRGEKNDTVATSRHKAATKLSDIVMKKGRAGSTWISIHNSNIAFVRVAQDKIPDRERKTGSKFILRKLPTGAKLEQTIQDLHQKIPPPTTKIALRNDGDYSSIPSMVKFDQTITIAGGISAPKIVTAIATDGSQHKMLLKGGNDDLRQDSIMEQVFEQVSNLLKDHRTTRQRNLGIRTYKVIPLTHNAGIIEFVQNTIPLHDYVLPAHMRYHPKDFKAARCRKEISDAQTKPLNQRIQAYRNVTANFRPVMRFFFMEYFLDPDDWFEKRRNYSRSTAAISMLGHVLGLGDRHGHNILLDTTTGEVVHIDLGVAFEAGRVLPVPEVVPFRLTRDLVDAMGISGVEGVFRRCCNFTLEALRQDQEAIMTTLDVLRWDPLYSWSISPLRLQRMQENQEQAASAAAAAAAAATGPSVPSSTALSTTSTSTDDATTKTGKAIPKEESTTSPPPPLPPLKPATNVTEPSEADRALAVVARKLGKSLSVEATVNDLIRQATDERNLAVLYFGWAAYA